MLSRAIHTACGIKPHPHASIGNPGIEFGFKELFRNGNATGFTALVVLPLDTDVFVFLFASRNFGAICAYNATVSRISYLRSCTAGCAAFGAFTWNKHVYELAFV